MEVEIPVVIVGAGPGGLATSACLNKHSISNIILEKDDCHASLWRKRAYDRLKLHLGKDFCNLPHMPFPSDFPTFVPRVDFLRYLDDYVTQMKICIQYNRYVNDASFDVTDGKWRVCVHDTTLNVNEIYVADYLIVATGENCDPYIPMINGLESFEGEYLHCSKYLNGRLWYDKNVLVVGSGNSGMEIAYDVSTWGANTSMVIRSPVHYLTKEMVYIGMSLLKYISIEKIDKLMVFMSKMVNGDMSKYGLVRPKDGPFAMKKKGGRTPTIDVGCVKQIKKGKVKVYPAISSIKKGKIIEFADGKRGQFDVIVFATGYRSSVQKWLKDYKELFNENGMPKARFPDHWKGENGIYCAGFSQNGLQGIHFDALKIANDISFTVNAMKHHDAEANAEIKLLDE
ncbi:putative indole-3-pyruvate monooxygenase [Medicago truncatula]|uniref:Flavin-containing monooxygenase n=1 Tax=Medicago truncatula TaxID=3880 RepID=A0A072V073_MEDTR|nr:probable indole-3-pyruvate monooxygenase YUCCA10 [Medicago truncatula]KEH35394.1 flavin containing monooxygenase YUCCA10-like protein [Medicago truncatula]RHN69530.1 putative indole-3-pyruvate monooxygenase [Medicago truncatula]